MDAPKMGRGRVWLDVTTTTHAGGHFDGTTRVERSLIRELPQYLAERLGFCAYNRTLRHFSEVARPASDSPAAPGQGRGKRRGGGRSVGKAVEQVVRGFVKGAVGQVASSTDRLLGRSLFPEAAAGDTLLLAGENWSRHDFAVLRHLRQHDGLRIAALLQDMIPHVRPQFFESPAFIARFRTYVDFLVDDADLVFAISDCTRNDFLNAAPAADPAKVVRVELGAEIGSAGRQQRPTGLGALGERPFVLSVSTIQVRKNFDLLYRLWQKFSIDGRADQPHLVVVGREGFGSADLLHLMRNDPSIAGTVTILHRTSDAELAWLYAHAAFTLYPSWYEGWGLPLSESLAYGKTFIASNTSSLPEAGQGLGIHLDPYDLVSWGREVLRLTNDISARSAMEQKILAERRLASWADCARQIAEAVDHPAQAAT
jgi:glycosyltransferase involved in cell wall biosynthesis